MAEREFDLTILGATGFTGTYVLRNAILWQDIENKPRKIAIAGRSETKLVQLIKETESHLNRKLEVGIIVVDVHDEVRLIKMCGRSRVVLNTLGPYIEHGEPVVKACLKAKTHMVDISGEPQYIEETMIKYHQAAKEAGVYIISACGVDCLPSEIGLNFLKEKFGYNQMDNAEGYLTGKIGELKNSLSVASLDTFIDLTVDWPRLSKIRKQLFSTLFTKTAPVSKYGPRVRYIPWFNPGLGWCLPYLNQGIIFTDINSAWFYECDNERPIKFFQYVTFSSLKTAILILIGVIYFLFMCVFGITRCLLRRFPHQLTHGLIAKEGEKPKTLKDAYFTLTLIAKGWKNAAETKNYSDPPDRTITCVVSGPDLGYDATSRCLLQAGMTILDEAEKMPFTGGAIPPSFAFRRTSILNRLNQHEIKFQIIE